MTDDRTQRLQALFAAAVEVPEHERAAWLEHACVGEPAMLQKLQRLLYADQHLQGKTVRPAAIGLGELVARMAPMASLEGSLIGPYRLCESLGQGGMGSVYRAERVDGSVHQQVAIKFVRRELIDANTLRRFQLERQTLASLDHPNIARLIDASALADGTPYFVMDYVAGATITDYCTRAELGLRPRLHLFAAVCAAVSHAHRNLVVHRDLKPGNILVTEQGVPKLLDFGIAKSLNATATATLAEQTGTAQRFFSPRYAAPEQLLGEAINVGCDIYALGLLLFELLTGVAPFELEGLSAGQIERLITSVPAPAPSVRALQSATPAVAAHQLRGDLDDIVLRCLRKAPSERYPSVEQLESDLGFYLAGRPIGARGGHLWYRLRKFTGRNRLSVGIASVSALALMLAGLALLRQNQALLLERDRARQSLQILKDAFAAADPSRVAGADITARQILDAARSKIEPAFSENPELYQSLAATIAEVDLSVGRSREAAAMAARATVAARRANAVAANIAGLLILEGKALANVDDVAGAKARLAEAKALGADNSLDWKLAHARVLTIDGSAKEAAAFLQDVLKEIAAWPASDELATQIRWQSAEARRIAGEEAMALQEMDATLAWQRTTLAEAHPLVTRSRLRRVELLRANARIDEAVQEAHSVIQEVERIYGSGTSLAAYAHSTTAYLLTSKGQTRAAVAESRLALEAWRASLGIDHSNTQRAIFNLAMDLWQFPEHHAEAEQLFGEALQAATHKLGDSHELTLYFRLFYAKFLIDRDRPSEAAGLLLVPGLQAGVAAASAENRRDYLETATQAQAAADCVNSALAHELVCRSPSLWLADPSPPQR